MTQYLTLNKTSISTSEIKTIETLFNGTVETIAFKGSQIVLKLSLKKLTLVK